MDCRLHRPATRRTAQRLRPRYRRPGPVRHRPSGTWTANLVRGSRAINDYLTASPLAERLNNLAVPTELVFGTQDAQVAAPHGAFAHLEQAHLTVLPGIGHTPPWEAPDQVAELITAALPAGSQNK